MAVNNISLLRFARRTPQPPIRTARGNFRYSAWTAQTYTITNPTNPATSAFALTQPASTDDTLRLFLFGQDNIARGVVHSPTGGDLYTPQVLTAVSAYGTASTAIVPASVPAAGESVYATINGVAGIRGVLAEQVIDVGPTADVSPIVDVSFDSGVIAGYSNFTVQQGAFYRPVLLNAAVFSQAIVDNGYVFTDSSGDRGVVVGVYEFVGG